MQTPLVKNAVIALLIALIVSSSTAALVPAFAYAAKTPTLDGKLCSTALHGTWAAGKTPVCTVSGVTLASASFTIPAKTTLVIGASGNFTNTATITNYGIVDDKGAFSNEPGAVLGNYGVARSDSGSTFANEPSGLVLSYGTFNNHGTFHNYGSFYDEPGSILYNYNDFRTSDANFYNIQGTVYNYGTFATTGLSVRELNFYNNGVFNNGPGGGVTISGQNVNYGVFHNGLNSTVSILGNLLNYNRVDNYGTITITENSALWNYGSVNNFGSILNFGILANSGSFNQTGGSCTNEFLGSGCP